MKVYVVIRSIGYEGIPSVDNVFLSKENAKQYKYVYEQEYHWDMNILEREVYDAKI